MSYEHFEIPGRLSIEDDADGWPVLHVSSAWSAAEIHLHGAHVTRFRKSGDAPLLFLSERAEFAPGKPIRGGVPIIFPWFGNRDGQPAHGTARTTAWELEETAECEDGSVLAAFRLPADGGCDVTFRVTVGRTLRMDLRIANATDAPLAFENCLHTYFETGDIHRTEVRGLRGAGFIDSLTGQRHTDTADAIRFAAETDRIYQNTTAACEIHDPAFGRVITVRKSGSRSTVVWNPWTDKSKRMADFGDDEYLRMVCVESGNVKDDAITLAPGGSELLTVEIDSAPVVEKPGMEAK